MQISQNQITKLLFSKTNYLVFILYGNDEGLINKILKKIINHTVGEDPHNLATTYLNAKDIINNEIDIINEANTLSFGKDKRAIIINNYKETLLKHIQNFANNYTGNSIVIINELNLSSSSKFLKFIKEHKKCFAISCYHEDSKNLIKKIETRLTEHNIKLDNNLLKNIVKKLGNDYQVTDNEINKIILYAKNNHNNYNTKDLITLINDNKDYDLNDFLLAIFEQNINLAFSITEKLNEYNEIVLLRIIADYFQKLCLVTQQKNLEAAVANLKPPIFWKIKNKFINFAKQLKYQKCLDNIQKIIQAEKLIKENGKIAKLIFNKTICEICKI